MGGGAGGGAEEEQQEGVECSDKSPSPLIPCNKINTLIEPLKAKLKTVQEDATWASWSRFLAVQSARRRGRCIRHATQSGEQDGRRPNLVSGAGAALEKRGLDLLTAERELGARHEAGTQPERKDVAAQRGGAAASTRK